MKNMQQYYPISKSPSNSQTGAPPVNEYDNLRPHEIKKPNSSLIKQAGDQVLKTADSREDF